MARREARHEDPVWRDRSDFVIAVALAEESVDEQLWARQLTDDTFEVCCIPFFVYDIALGDVVQTALSGSRRYMVERVVRRSGRFVFRAWFGGSCHPRDEIAEELKRRGALLEWSSVNLLAVDAEDESHAQTIADFLQERQDLGQVLYETGRS